MGNCRCLRFAVVLGLCAFAGFGADNQFVVVSKDIAKVMILPYGDAKLISMVQKGDRCKVIAKNGEWYNVEINGAIGWIFQSNVTAPESEAQASPPSHAVVQRSAVTASSSPPQSPQTRIPSRQSFSPSHQPAAEVSPQSESVAPPAVRNPPGPSGQRPPESSDEQAANRMVRKQKKTQFATVDLPPASVTPLRGSRVLPTYSSEVSRGTASNESMMVREDLERPTHKYFEITESQTNVLDSISPDSPIRGMAHYSECYPLLYIGSSWCKIQFGKTEGWVDRRCGKIVATPPATKEISRIVLYSSLGGVGFVLTALVIVLVVITLRTKSARKVAVKKDLLIIAKSEKEIQYSLTDSTTTMAKCFSEIGFHVNYAIDLDHARNLLVHYLPDVIIVDWQIENNVAAALNSVLSNRTSTSNILVIFYNVPDTVEASRRKAVPNVHFLGIAFSDRDIFKLVTPLIITETETKSIRKSVETSALGGDVAPGSLIEVMQFIEIGRKTGCLYVVVDKPFGLIFFEQGRLVYAVSPRSQGRESVFEILNLDKGHFSFVLDKTTDTKNVNLSTLEILMEWTKTVDEAHRH